MWYERVPRWAWAVLAGVVLFSLGSAVYSSGWSQGFLMGLLTGHADGSQLTPYLAYRGGWHHGGFGFFGGLFRFVFLFFLLGLLFKAIGCWRWRMHGGPHGPWGHGPWAQPGRPEQGSPEQPGPQTGTTPDQPAESKPQPAVWTHV